MGFFTDAYDLFIIGIALVLIKSEWHPAAWMVGLVGSTSLVAAFLGAFVFGRLADLYGRKSVYGIEAMLMAAAAVASALAPNMFWLIVFRFLLGVGIGGDYPVSAVLMSEYANARDRGKLVGMVFSMQALGLVIGPMVALTILAAGANPDTAWRLMLGLGALPALGVIYLRRTMPESPRYLSRVKGETERAARQLAVFTRSQVEAAAVGEGRVTARLGSYALTLLGTAGTWFVFDYAYYGNSISTPLIMKMVAPHGTLMETVAWTLIIYAVAAVPGYILAFSTMDRIGHRRLQLIGFAAMGLAFLVLGLVPGMTTALLPFLVLYGLSYFFAEFGPNTTTFVLSGELFPVNLRATGHGLSAGIAKFGAFLGVFVFPILSTALGLAGTLLVTFGFSVVGFLLTLLLPEPAGQTLEAAAREDGALLLQREIG
ncbi:MAG: MFS transporter [Actinomycetia bacterium]|nr:MFS transporter [Actinomycetes bacterium]